MNVMQKVFNQWEKNNIRYIHFKSNINLNESFNGKADFDVLVDKKCLADIERIIAENNGKRFNPVKYGRYPGVDNWIIFDDETGILYHLHLHYQIASGKALIKDYIIPWEERLFQTRIKDENYNVYISDPNMEILLLLVRSVIKSRFSDHVNAAVGRYKLHSSLLYEKEGLINRIDDGNLRENISLLFSEQYQDIIYACSVKAQITSKEFRALCTAVRKTMRNSRRMAAITANCRAAAERVGDLYAKVRSRKFGKTVITKKVSLSGGAIIAFVGSDGSGKSTVTNEIQKWLSKKIECKRFYMGTGDGKTTILGSAIKSVGNKVSVDPGQISTPHKLSVIKQPKQFFRKFFKMILISDVEKNNRKKIIDMNRYRINGGISVLDRYPQIEIEGQNDGPKIGQYEPYFGNSGLVKRLKNKELRNLSIVKTIKPDVVFRLNITAETALMRKDDLKKDDPVAVKNFRKKVEDVKRINFQGAHIIDIDAEQPYEDEILQIKRIIWEQIL